MNTFIYSQLQKLRLTIALRMLHSEEDIKKIYCEVAKARTLGMLLDALKKLPEEERKIIKNILSPETKIVSKLMPLKKYVTPIDSFKFSNEDFKRKQRLETLDRIQKSKSK